MAHIPEKRTERKDLGTATKILEIEIHKDRGSRKLWLSKRGFVEKVLDRFRMSKTKLVNTLLANHFKLSSEQCHKTDREIEDIAKVSYASAVSCLMYAMGIVGHGVVFCSQQNDLLAVGYIGSNYTSDLDDRRSTTGTKYIDVRYHEIRELIPSGEIILQKVHTSENAADMLTKSLTVNKFNYCVELLNVYSC
ncbi:UNVERIFIED_CONTAM: hypothetical protein Sangu_1692400 [Sesamum angustifolium]|uniref:Uncharacterized protein n=1 Tax=Sesamum angustifolium TaxID=2727405 RepID=A0AAW2MIW5_9LAMI